MKRIINGKKYDTDKSEEIANYRNTGDRGDFKYCEETLYRSPKGNWFLYGQGGAMSKYATRHVDGGASSGEAIVPLDEHDAYQWLESHGETETIERYFSGNIEDA